MRRCRVEATHLEKGKSFVFCKELPKARFKNRTSWRQVQCKGRWREKQGEMRIDCQRESKRMQREVLLPDMEGGKQMKSKSIQRKRQNEIEINTYLQQRVFSSLH